LNDQELAELSAIATLRRYKAGETIMAHDEPAGFLGNIVSGTVKLTKILSDGRQQIIGLQFAPDFLGRAYSKQAPYFAEAVSDVELCYFPKKKFEAMLTKFPELEHRLFRDTLDELDSAREWMLLLGRKTAQEKIASFLYMIARRSAMVGCRHSDALAQFAGFTLPLTRADMADYLGLTIETVSRQFTRLKTSGLIRILSSREIMVPDLDALAEAAGLTAHDLV
jgi:CRP/FNR family transcriptional regulator